MLNQTKQDIRDQILKRLRKKKEVELLKKSFLIQKKLFSLFEFIKAKTILFYLSFRGEVETFRMIDKAISQGKSAAVPVIDKYKRSILPSLLVDGALTLEVGPYGIYQPKPRLRRPVPIGNIDLIIVPGIAFDSAGNRLGRGKGYYDRFLNSLPKRIPAIGLAYDFQVLDKLPFITAFDYRMDRVLSA